MTQIRLNLSRAFLFNLSFESAGGRVHGMAITAPNSIFVMFCPNEVGDDDGGDLRTGGHGSVGLVVPTKGQVAVAHHLPPFPLPHPPLCT